MAAGLGFFEKARKTAALQAKWVEQSLKSVDDYGALMKAGMKYGPTWARGPQAGRRSAALKAPCRAHAERRRVHRRGRVAYRFQRGRRRARCGAAGGCSCLDDHRWYCSTLREGASLVAAW